MAVSEAIADQRAELFGEGAGDFARVYIEKLCASCDLFLRWERKHIIEREPNPEESKQHRDALKWMLRMTRLLQTVVSDPEYPDHVVRDHLEHEVWRLDQSWKMIYEAMPEAQANKLLAEIFPEEPRA